MHFLSRFFAKTPKPQSDAPCPAEPIAVIGDIHGRADLLDNLLSALNKDHPDHRKVFVGDYVDRGPESQAVLDRLRSLPDAICLRGNHEEMLLDFLDNPSDHAQRWLHNGGRNTLTSYRIDPTDDIPRVHEAFLGAISDGTADWLRALPCFWRSGNVLICHAGPNPAEPVEVQPDHVFTWGHSRFLRNERIDGLWVVHGHWVQDRPHATDGRIAVDTGACFTGKLTAALIRPRAQVEFLTSRI